MKLESLTIIALFVVSICLSACQTAESVGEDAKETPIGSVLSGKTTSADSYLERVKQQNKSLDKDTWRPQSNEQF